MGLTYARWIMEEGYLDIAVNVWRQFRLAFIILYKISTPSFSRNSSLSIIHWNRWYSPSGETCKLWYMTFHVSKTRFVSNMATGWKTFRTDWNYCKQVQINICCRHSKMSPVYEVFYPVSMVLLCLYGISAGFVDNHILFRVRGS